MAQDLGATGRTRALQEGIKAGRGPWSEKRLGNTVAEDRNMHADTNVSPFYISFH